MPQPVTPAVTPYAVLKNRNFLFYTLGRFLSSLGMHMLTVAVGWDLYERTGSALNLGYVGLSQFLPMLVMTLPAGHVADRYDRRKVMMFTQAIVTFASLGLELVTTHSHSIVWIYLCLATMGVARTFLWSATAAFLPQLVTREEFPQAVSWSSSSFNCSAVAGPAVGGALIALTKSAAPVYALNMATALACLILLYFIRFTPIILKSAEPTLTALLGGFKFVFSTPLILAAITLDLFAVLFGGATALLPIYAKDILHVGPQGLGILQAALPVGALICALHFAHRPPLRHAGRALFLSVVAFGLATIGFGLSRSFVLSITMLLICGYADNISVIVRHTLVQMLTPDEMRGRVSAVNNLFIGTSNELGGFESGSLSSYAGPVFSVVFGGIATIITLAVVAWRWPHLGRYGSLSQRD